MQEQLSIQFPEFIDNTDREHIEFRYSITSYGADYPVDSIVKRIKNKAILVPTFQRRYVWNIEEASKFIESLILGLPVPGIFLSKEKNSNNHLIVDGQQRLLTLYYYYANNFKDEEFKLVSVQKDLEGKRYQDLLAPDKNRLDDSIIHATIIRQDEPDDNDSSIYQIFERINSGGRPLSSQEIRACIYHGPYNTLLGKLSQNINWRNIVGGAHNDRLKEEELILRYFSLLYDLSYYKKPMKDFLNRRMYANKDLKLHSEEKLKPAFENVISFIDDVLGKDAFRYNKGIHTAIYDSVMIATYRRLERGPILLVNSYLEVYNKLLENRDFFAYINSGTSDENSTNKRIQLAISAFSKVQ